MSLPNIIIAGRHTLSETGNNRTYTCYSHTLHLFDYRVTLTVEGLAYHLQPGDAALAPSETKVMYEAPAPTSHFCFHFELDDDSSREMVSSFTVFRLGERHLEFLSECRRIQRDFDNGSEWLLRSAQSGLYRLLCQAHAMSETKPQALSKADHALLRAVEWLDANMHLPVRVQDLADEVGLDSNYLARKFKEKNGKTIQGYLRNERLSRAYHWLVNTDLPIKVIAADLGFYDLQHFYRCFKTRYHATPVNVRART